MKHQNLEPRDLQQRLSRGDIASLYLLVGDETFMQDEIVDLLKAVALDGGLADFNLNTFYASDCNVQEVKDAVETLPMMAARRLVLLKQCQDLSASELEQLVSIIENPVETTVFALVGTKADMRKKVFKLLESKGVVCKFQRPYENQMNPWVEYIAKKHKKTLTPEAIEAIKEWVGVNLTEINNEMIKVAQYVGDRQQITVDDLKAVVSRSKTETVFDLVSSMGRGDGATAFTLLANLLDQGQNEIGVLAMTIRHFRILLLCQEALREGLSPSQIATRVGVHPYFVKGYIEQAKDHSSEHLFHIYDVLLDTDRALKSNPLSSHLWLENLVLQACRLGAL